MWSRPAEAAPHQVSMHVLLRWWERTPGLFLSRAWSSPPSSFSAALSSSRSKRSGPGSFVLPVANPTSLCEHLCTSCAVSSRSRAYECRRGATVSLRFGTGGGCRRSCLTRRGQLSPVKIILRLLSFPFGKVWIEWYFPLSCVSFYSTSGMTRHIPSMEVKPFLESC